MIIIYDNKFNQNELFTIILLILGIILVLIFKERFTKKEMIAYFLYSVFLGMVFDHTISVVPWDYYDVNDTSSYQLMDFLSYIMYGPYGYLFIYFYDRFKLKSCHAPIYILLWAVISVVLEFVAQSIGVYHYKNGYKIFYSFPIYLLVLTSNLCLYKLLHRNRANS